MATVPKMQAGPVEDVRVWQQEVCSIQHSMTRHDAMCIMLCCAFVCVCVKGGRHNTQQTQQERIHTAHGLDGGTHVARCIVLTGRMITHQCGQTTQVCTRLLCAPYAPGAFPAAGGVQPYGTHTQTAHTHQLVCAPVDPVRVPAVSCAPAVVATLPATAGAAALTPHLIALLRSVQHCCWHCRCRCWQ